MLKMILDALDGRGDAMMVIERPAAGADATIQIVNARFAQMVGQTADALAGTPLGGLRRLVADHDWNALMAALRSGTPLELDIKLAVGNREAWFGFGLTFETEPHGAVACAVVLGRDVTEARRQAAREVQSQRLLVSIFARISTPVTLVQGDGTIIMSNPAYNRMIGCSAEELVGRNVAEFTPPECYEASRRARAEVPLGGSYELPVVILARSGARIPVRLTMSLLNDAQDRGLRVATHAPYITPPTPSGTTVETVAAGTDVATPRPRSVGQVQAISLAALKDAVGEEWPRVASRAMLLAEHIIRHRLEAADVVVRADEVGFIIWFDSADEHRNIAVLTAATREIRLRFLCDFGEEMACHVSAAVADDPHPVDAPARDGARAPTAALLERLRHGHESGLLPLRTLLQELRDAPVAQVDPVVDRDGRTRPLVLVDFPVAIRHRLNGASAALAHDADHGVDLDLVRLGLATRELVGRLDDSRVLVPISWLALSSPDRRWSIDAHLGTIDHRLRSRLVIAVSGVPPLRTDARWRKVIDPLCRQFGDVGLMVTLTETGPGLEQEAKLREWPIGLLVIDATEQEAATHEGYFGLITAARRRPVDVLVRVAAGGAIADWRELGGTLFAGAQAGLGSAQTRQGPRPLDPDL